MLELRRRRFEVDGLGEDERRGETFAAEIRAESEVRRAVEREFGMGGEGETEEIGCSCHLWT